MLEFGLDIRLELALGFGVVVAYFAYYAVVCAYSTYLNHSGELY